MEHETEIARVVDGEGEIIIESFGKDEYKIGAIYVTITPSRFPNCMDVRTGFDGGAGFQAANGRELRALAELVDMLADAHHG